MPRKFSTRYRKTSGMYTKFRPISKKRAYNQVSSYNRRTLASARRNRAAILEVEKKFLDVSASALAIPTVAAMTGGTMAPTAGCTGCLSCPAQGDGPQNRDGLKIICKSIQIEGIVSIPIQINQTALDVMPTIFIALVQDTQTNLLTTASEDVYTNPSGATIMCTAPLRNMSNSERFKVLKTETIQVPQLMATYDGTNIEQAGMDVKFSMFCKLGNMGVRITTGGTAANVNTVTDNSLHLIAFTSIAIGLVPVLAYNARLRFIG